ncbi:hypothetical protein EVJ58_g3658 [Rhodofomes roseus]|uniref:Uncharacterized protein n=1 Tax=Rhodofomes roseus TaxID=34475 RepID=A0A4Y9YLS7_9APHY|nr:hypothetical protein EVJ58_g3658 [Rhodofomes roseus]
MHPFQLPVSAFPVPSAAANDTSRLPPYRQSYTLRYHPYARSSRHPADVMVGDCCTGDENPVVAQPTPLPLIEEVEEEDLVNLENALPVAPTTQKLRRRLSALVIDLAFVVRRRCSGLRSPKKLAYPEKMDLLV